MCASLSNKTDFTKDAYAVSSGAWDSLDASPLWTAEWFGKTDEEDGAISDGRWARTEIPTDEEIHNSCKLSTHDVFAHSILRWNCPDSHRDE